MLSVLGKQCLDGRIGELGKIRSEVVEWEQRPNTMKYRVDWQFRTADPRVSLNRLYPSIQTG